MKKALWVFCCALGSGMIGFFAKDLGSVIGSVFFTLGVFLLVFSIINISKENKKEQ